MLAGGSPAHQAAAGPAARSRYAAAAAQLDLARPGGPDEPVIYSGGPAGYGEAEGTAEPREGNRARAAPPPGDTDRPAQNPKSRCCNRGARAVPRAVPGSAALPS